MDDIHTNLSSHIEGKTSIRYYVFQSYVYNQRILDLPIFLLNVKSSKGCQYKQYVQFLMQMNNDKLLYAFLFQSMNHNSKILLQKRKASTWQKRKRRQNLCQNMIGHCRP